MTEIAIEDGAPLLIDVKAVSKLTSLSQRTIWRWVSCGRFIAPLRLGGKRLWRRADIEQWVLGGCPPVGVRR